MRLDYEACLAYLLLPPAGGALLLVFERKSDYVRFHAWQSSLVFGFLFVSHPHADPGESAGCIGGVRGVRLTISVTVAASDNQFLKGAELDAFRGGFGADRVVGNEGL